MTKSKYGLWSIRSYDLTNMFKRLTLALVVVSLIVLPYLQLRNDVQAAALTSMSDTLTRLDNSTLASHDILFTLPAAETFDSGQTITYDFNEDGSDWAVDGASSAVADFDFTTVKGSSTTDAVILDVTVGAPDCTGEAGANDVAIGINDTTGVVTVEACSTFTSTDTASTINLEYGTAAGGTDRVTNPAATGSTVLAIDHASGTNTGSLAVPIMTDDQVTVSATVDPTITSSLDTTACALGTLTDAAVNGCEIVNTVSTNAASGYISTITENGDLCSPSVAVCTNDIADVTDTDIIAGDEEYGVSTTDADATGITADYDGVTCGGATENASAIDGTAKVYADETTPQSSDATTLCHAASITATTESGSYSHIVTHITTGTF